MSKRRVLAYVDGFNFYYRRLRNQPYRWLNLVAPITDSSGERLESVSVWRPEEKGSDVNLGESGSDTNFHNVGIIRCFL